MIIEVTHNKSKWAKALRKLNRDHSLSDLVPPIGSNFGAHWFIAIEQGEIVATAACESWTRNYKFMFLGPCSVIPSARGKGLQRQLIERREAKGLALGFTTFVTTVVYTNAPSVNNFIKAGYLTYSPDFENTFDFLYFKKTLVDIKPQ